MLSMVLRRFYKLSSKTHWWNLKSVLRFNEFTNEFATRMSSSDANSAGRSVLLAKVDRLHFGRWCS
ncbi:MAG: hypothetical protein ACTS6A_02620 [Candidatus Hodgkinia cicadicola]